jgi:uncharacterized protein (DUF2249 family)
MNTSTDISLPAPCTARPDTHFDVRPIPCRQKHALIFQRWAELPTGEHFVLINDHDPIPLYYQFAGQFPEAFSWEYLVAGADEFHVRITRLKPTPAPVKRAGLPALPTQVRPSPEKSVPGPRQTTDAAAQAVAAEVDARGLEPPEPMLRILSALEVLQSGGCLRARTDRKPIHLLPELDARGVSHESEEQADGSWITTLRRV